MDHDPEPDVYLRIGETEIYFLAAREECFSIADIELIGTGGKICYVEGGAKIDLRKTDADPIFPGYMILSQQTQTANAR